MSLRFVLFVLAISLNPLPGIDSVFALVGTGDIERIYMSSIPSQFFGKVFKPSEPQFSHQSNECCTVGEN